MEFPKYPILVVKGVKLNLKLINLKKLELAIYKWGSVKYIKHFRNKKFFFGTIDELEALEEITKDKFIDDDKNIFVIVFCIKYFITI